MLMSLGDLTKQLAEQALRNTVKDAPAAPAAPANPCAVMLGQVQAMQKALKADEELLVLFKSGGETVRVQEIFVPMWDVVVLSGLDAEKNVTRVISRAEVVQLVCKVVKVQPPAKPGRVAVIGPKS